MDLPKQVVAMSFGEPRIYNVIGVNYETKQLQLQTPGKYGSHWTYFDNLMSYTDIIWHYMCFGLNEIERLEEKKIELEKDERRQF